MDTLYFRGEVYLIYYYFDMIPILYMLNQEHFHPWSKHLNVKFWINLVVYILTIILWYATIRNFIDLTFIGIIYHIKSPYSSPVEFLDADIGNYIYMISSYFSLKLPITVKVFYETAVSFFIVTIMKPDQLGFILDKSISPLRIINYNYLLWM